MENIDKNNAMFSSEVDDSHYFDDASLYNDASEYDDTPLYNDASEYDTSIPELSVESIKVKKIGKGRKRVIFQRDTFDVIPPTVAASGQTAETEFYDDFMEDDYATADEQGNIYMRADRFDEYSQAADQYIEDEFEYMENNLVERNTAYPAYEYEPQHYYEPNMEENATLVKIPMVDMQKINPDETTMMHMPMDELSHTVPVEPEPEILTASVSVNQIDLKSVARTSSAVGGAIGIIWILFLGILYFLLDILGVWAKFNSSFSGGSAGISGSLISTWTILLFTLISGVLLGITIICISLFISVIYNLCAETFGGIRIELKDSPWEKQVNELSKE